MELIDFQINMLKIERLKTEVGHIKNKDEYNEGYYCGLVKALDILKKG